MKVKVIKAFIDRETRVHRSVGEVIEVTEKRFNEISSVGNFVIKVDEPETLTFETMKIEELKAYAIDNGIDIGKAKKKAEILAIIKNQQ